MTLDTWLIPSLIWDIALACSLDAVSMSLIRSETVFTSLIMLPTASAVSLAILLPSSIFFTESSIKAVVPFTASADFAARFLTSSATTANPLPAAPARAA